MLFGVIVMIIEGMAVVPVDPVRLAVPAEADRGGALGGGQRDIGEGIRERADIRSDLDHDLLRIRRGRRRGDTRVAADDALADRAVWLDPSMMLAMVVVELV